MEDNRMRFAKLMTALGKQNQPKALSNPDIDEVTAKRLKQEQELALIDDKISQLEESSDPNALESLNFWKKRRSQLSPD